jgi:hypothetical protein
MPIYLCRVGHKNRTQDAAVNCARCKRNERRILARCSRRITTRQKVL